MPVFLTLPVITLILMLWLLDETASVSQDRHHNSTIRSSHHHQFPNNLVRFTESLSKGSSGSACASALNSSILTNDQQGRAWWMKEYIKLLNLGSLDKPSNETTHFLASRHSNRAAVAMVSRLGVVRLQNMKSMEIFNIGEGTTGTTELFAFLCNDLQLSSVHFFTACAKGQRTSYVLQRNQYPLLDWYRLNFTKCLSEEFQHRLPHCQLASQSHYFSYALYETFSLGRLSSKYHALLDAPLAIIFQYLLVLFHDQVKMIFQTVRDPASWWRSRFQHHGQMFHFSMICHPDLWPALAHPFDFIACIQMKPYVVDAIVHRDKLIEMWRGDVAGVDRVFANAFAEMNIFNALIAPASKHHIMCMWDHNSSLPRYVFTPDEARAVKEILLRPPN